MTVTKKFFSAVAIALLLLVTIGCDNSPQKAYYPDDDKAREKLRMVMTTSGTKNGIDTLIAKRIADSVREASDGNVIIEVYDSDMLAGGNTTQGVGMIADGSVDLAAYSSGIFANLDYRLAVATLPWAFDSYETARRVIDETGGDFYREILGAQGLHYLGSAHNGMRQLSNNQRAVRRPDEVSNLKIRISGNEDSRLFFQTFEAVPNPMSRSEISPALKQGIIDGHDMGFFQINSVRHAEDDIKYMTDWHYSYEDYLFVANSKTFDRLDEETRRLIEEKTKEACAWGQMFLEESEPVIKEKFIADGIIITELSDAELEPFKKRVEPVVKRLKAKYGKEACRAFQIPFDE